jgi:hypothetical protein
VHSFRSVGDESTFVVVLCRARILGRKALGVAQGLDPPCNITFVHPPASKSRERRGALGIETFGEP